MGTRADGVVRTQWPPADARCRKLTPYRRRWRLNLRFRCAALRRCWCLIPTVDRPRAALPAFRPTCCEFFTNTHAAASASTADTRAPARMQHAHRLAGGGAGGDDVVNHQQLAAGRQTPAGQQHAPGDVAFTCGAVQPRRVAGQRRHPQRPHDGDVRVARRRQRGDPCHRVAAAVTGRPAAGRRRDDGQRNVEQTPQQ